MEGVIFPTYIHTVHIQPLLPVVRLYLLSGCQHYVQGCSLWESAHLNGHIEGYAFWKTNTNQAVIIEKIFYFCYSVWGGNNNILSILSYLTGNVYEFGKRMHQILCLFLSVALNVYPSCSFATSAHLHQG